MKLETLIHLIGASVFAIIGITSLIAALFFGAWWHFVTFFMCLLMTLILYHDDDFESESVRSLLKRKLKNK